MSEGTSREAIRRVKKRVERDLLELPNVHAVDIAEKIKGGKPTGKLSIVVYVDKKKDVAAKNTVPKDIDGVVTDVQEEEPDVLHPALIKLEDDELLIDTTRYATLEGGMSMGPCRSIYMEPPDVTTAGWYITVGTLGAIVRDRSTDAIMALTNFHVAAVDDTWSVGDDMAQPARNDGGSCPTDRFGALQRGVLSANVDGAVVSIDDRPHLCEILDIGEVAGTRTATVGMAVRKRGRTTELTHGEVISTDYTTTIPYGDGLGSVTLVDQIRIKVVSPSTLFGTNGDSGSVVVDDDRKVVGLYFAGNSSGSRGVANPIAKVLSELDIEICSNVKPLDKLPKEGSKEIIKEFKVERAEKHHFKEWLKWEKSEKEKPEKLEFEKRHYEGKTPIQEKGPQIEKDPRVEKGPQIEKDPRVEKGFEQPPGKPTDGAPPAARQAAIQGFGPRDPFAHPLKNFFDKPFPEVVKDPKENKDNKIEGKEWKNENKENKELKDNKEGKDNKDGKDGKDSKEMVFETPPGGGVFTPGGGAWSGPPGGAFHFIPQDLRPDLSRGALRNEP